MTRRNPTARQAALLEELLGIFLAEGFADVTLDDFAGRLRCSKSTLYALAPSKEQLSARVVGHFFRGATERIEKRVALAVDARDRIARYLDGCATELGPASPRFVADVSAFAPTRAMYQRNAKAAAARIRGLILDGVAEGLFRDVHAHLVAEMAGWLIEGIQQGVLAERTGESDGVAFAALADLLLVGINRGPGGIDPAEPAAGL
ncbi:TetR/AcrR family transcriptional regulator [Actinokineospora inagensis]|uniref:TetR/AcrR family transcriptional regulator n=1 Tax=Actinokineospora inagensis TaxID=103730 RepID=UPI0004056A51|nr:TetR/AcrR family transcriptional regulator [Actinokineospora inagensis]